MAPEQLAVQPGGLLGVHAGSLTSRSLAGGEQSAAEDGGAVSAAPLVGGAAIAAGVCMIVP